MERSELVDQIVARVSAKLAERGVSVEADQIRAVIDGEKKPGLLILTERHGERCDELLNSAELKRSYRTSCALLEHYEVDWKEIDAVILFGLTNAALAKIAGGAADTEFTALAQRAILEGKRIYAVREEVELFRYEGTAPGPYYEMLGGKLRLLEESGVRVLSSGEIEAELSGGAAAVSGSCAPAEKSAAAPERAAGAEEKEISFSKRVITERDVIEADKKGVSRIRLSPGNILTDLARDAAKVRNIVLLKS